MSVITFLLLFAPGLIAMRILWNAKEIKREDYKFIACDYVIYSFLIHMAVYGVMFFTFPTRSVSFVTEVRANSHILSASFVFKYAAVSLVTAVILPALVPRLIKFWTRLESKRESKREIKRESERESSMDNNKTKK